VTIVRILIARGNVLKGALRECGHDITDIGHKYCLANSSDIK